MTEMTREILNSLLSLYPLQDYEEQAIDEVLKSEPHWIPVTKEEMFKAGHEGREIRFKVDGRLFAIRELAQ